MVGAALLVLTSSSALAATSTAAIPATNGYRVSPVRTSLTVNPGTSQTVTVFIQNASSAVEDLQTIIDDFEPPSNQSGNPQLLLNGALASSHSLKQFVTVPDPTFILQPNQQVPVNVIISVPAGTAGGGYYGAVRFAPVGIGGGKNVNLTASVASLILITVPGNLVEQLTISSFGVTQLSGNPTASTKSHTVFFSNKNLQAIIRFKNTGNIQEQPFGKVELKRGKSVLNTFDVNNNGASPPSNVLPSSIRLFNVRLSKVGWYGKYQAEGNFGYGSNGQLLSASATFYVIPVLLIVLVILAILLILFLIFGLPRVLRAYNRRVIARANRRK
jgi:hypothetical protein